MTSRFVIPIDLVLCSLIAVSLVGKTTNDHHGNQSFVGGIRNGDIIFLYESQKYSNRKKGGFSNVFSNLISSLGYEVLSQIPCSVQVLNIVFQVSICLLLWTVKHTPVHQTCCQIHLKYVCCLENEELIYCILFYVSI